MPTTALSMGWLMWRAHRRWVVATAVYLAAAATISAVLPGWFSPPVGAGIAAVLVAPLLSALVYLLGSGTFGCDADVSSGGSCFPASLLTLPVRTVALAGWPLLYAAAAAAGLWIVMAALILQPWGKPFEISLPLGWPAALIAATVCWWYALIAMPLGASWLRVALTVVVCAGVVASAQTAARTDHSEGLLIALFGLAAAVGALGTYIGVRNARRGAVPNWKWLLNPFLDTAEGSPRESMARPQSSTQSSKAPVRGFYSSPSRALLWFEWRRIGVTLPIIAAVTGLFAILPYLSESNDAMPVGQMLLLTCSVPLLLAGMAGFAVSGKNASAKDYYGVSPFHATLPASTASLVAAKLKAAAWGTLAAWAIVALITAAAVMLTGRHGIIQLWQLAAARLEPVKLAVGLAACLSLLILFTWKRFVDSLLLGLTGRKWIINGFVLIGVPLFLCICALGTWLWQEPETFKRFLKVLPWMLAAFTACRVAAAAWALRQSLRQGLMAPQTVLCWLLGWLIVALVLFGILAWSLPVELSQTYLLAFAVVFTLPMVRLAACPLAFAWNRHR